MKKATPITDMRQQIAIKAFIEELALTGGTELIPTAQAAGVDHTALRLTQEFERKSSHPHGCGESLAPIR